MSDETVQDASESFDLRKWVRTISYEKIHATAYGAFLLFVAAMASSAYVLAGFVSIALWALGVRSSPFRYTVSGDPKFDGEQELKPHKKIFKEIRHKPHYFLGGGVVGEGIGRLAYYVVHGSQPDHWAQLPEIVSRLMLGVM